MCISNLLSLERNIIPSFFPWQEKMQKYQIETIVILTVKLNTVVVLTNGCIFCNVAL